jgi:hypothetical protein
LAQRALCPTAILARVSGLIVVELHFRSSKRRTTIV